MVCTNSQDFFAISMGPQPQNGWDARILCIKDFLKKCIRFPFALINKAFKTLFRLIGAVCAFLLLIITLGSSKIVRALFVDRIVIFAKDLADWILLPFALLWTCLRLLFALFIHPQFYFNAL